MSCGGGGDEFWPHQQNTTLVPFKEVPPPKELHNS